MSSQAQSFKALIGDSLHTLILGSMPGQASLQAQQYYAHSRNAFWPILCGIVRAAPPTWLVHTQTTYDQRCSELLGHGYGLWDVLSQCERPGSLDSAIRHDSEVPNDIVQLIRQHPTLQTIAFNGRTAEKLFKRHICLNSLESQPHLVSLPSTSPAMATLTLQQKYERWHKALILEH